MMNTRNPNLTLLNRLTTDQPNLLRRLQNPQVELLTSPRLVNRPRNINLLTFRPTPIPQIRTRMQLRTYPHGESDANRQNTRTNITTLSRTHSPPLADIPYIRNQRLRVRTNTTQRSM